MRLFQVVLRSGVNMDITAKSMLDVPEQGVVYFYRHENGHELVATVKRNELAGIIFHPRKSSVMTATTPLPSQRR